MKIDNTVKSPGNLGSTVPKDGARARTTRQPGQPQAAEVELSPLSSRLQEIESAMATTPIVDGNRVQEIREAISQGNFQIDAGKIADGLIDSVRQMLATRK